MDIVEFRSAVIHAMKEAGVDPYKETALLMDICLSALQYAKDYYQHLQRQD